MIKLDNYFDLMKKDKKKPLFIKRFFYFKKEFILNLTNEHSAQ